MSNSPEDTTGASCTIVELLHVVLMLNCWYSCSVDGGGARSSRRWQRTVQ